MINQAPTHLEAVTEAEAVCREIHPMLAGRHHDVQSIIVAELAATWICGHRAPGDPEGQRQVQENILTAFIQVVRELMAITNRENEGQ